MKHWLINIFTVIILISLVSCEDFLDRPSLDQLTEETFYLSVADAEKAVLAAYSPMQNENWVSKGWQITEIPSDNTQPGGTDPDFTPIDNFAVTADNGPVGNYWAIHYQQITLANVIIEKLGEMDITEAEKQPLEAEARFLRAIAYFDLVRIYGGVPLITKPPVWGDDLLYPRSPIADVYELIYSDLEFAGEHLTTAWSGSNLGRGTKGSALAFLGKAYLTQREYVKARDAAKTVMNLGVYDLMEDYGENFDLATCDNNKESVFQVQFAGCGPWGTGNAMQAFFAPWGEGITKDRDGWGSQVPTSPLVNNPNTTIFDAFEQADSIRRYHSIMSSNNHYPNINAIDGGYTYPPGGASASSVNIKKYVVGSGANICFMSTPQNAHVIRYSDVLLTYAESIMEIQGGITADPEALAAINQVRERAGIEPHTQIDREKIFHERRVEFAFEGHRWFDLIRMTNVIEVLLLHGKSLDQHNLLFPIPAGELEINPNLTQNPGY